MEKEKYEEPNLVVLSGDEYGIQPLGIALPPLLIVAAFVIAAANLLVAVAAAGVVALAGATQVHGVVNVDTYTTVS